MNLSTLISQQAQRLQDAQVSFGQGTTNALDEAAWLVLWQLQLPLDTNFEAHPHAPTEAEIAQCEALIHRRIESRLPAAYLTQEAWLQGVSFYVDERTIIPRSLIAEVLANGSIDPWLHPQTHHVLDLCTGNGSLAILTALAFPEVQVTGLDISADALDVAHVNVRRHGLESRVHLALSDGFSQTDQIFDLILCNPPYVNAQSMSTLPAEFQAEPALALAGGSDGMDFIRRLIHQAPQHMSEHALLVLELGHERAYFEAAFPTLDVMWLSTSAGDDQVLMITRAALESL